MGNLLLLLTTMFVAILYTKWLTIVLILLALLSHIRTPHCSIELTYPRCSDSQSLHIAAIQIHAYMEHSVSVVGMVQASTIAKKLHKTQKPHTALSHHTMLCHYTHYKHQCMVCTQHRAVLFQSVAHMLLPVITINNGVHHIWLTFLKGVMYAHDHSAMMDLFWHYSPLQYVAITCERNQLWFPQARVEGGSRAYT